MVLTQIISIDRILVSARRGNEETIKKGKKGKLNYHSMVYPPYQYSLPINPVWTLNAKWRLSGIDKVKVIDTKFESTSLVVAYGKDLFVTKVQPDSTFDLLTDDFNFTLLGVVTVAITVSPPHPDPRHCSEKAQHQARSQEEVLHLLRESLD